MNGRRILKTINSVGLSLIDKRCIRAGFYDVNNFGDQLTPDIFSYFGLKAIHCPHFQMANVVGVGSILHMLPSTYSGCILGSGLIDPSLAKEFPNARSLLVRGHLTREQCAFNKNILVGDPGLLADTIYKKYIANEKKWDIGIIPHYVDWGDRRIHELVKTTLTDVHLIDVRRDPHQVFHEISKCNCIISSSLHGLILAESLLIPSCWIKVSDKIIGGDFKFNDYYSCFGIKKKSIDINNINNINDLKRMAFCPPKDSIEKIKASIYESFKEFCSDI